MKRIGVVLGLVGCGFTPSSLTQGDDDANLGDGRMHDAQIDASPDAWYAGYHYRKPITVTTALTGPLTDFPLGLVRTQDPQIAAHASGQDLVVTAGDAITPLDRELVTSMVDGTIELWVRVPQLGAGAQTLYLYYGGSAATSSTSMWANNAGVWHLSDVGPMVVDSSINHNALGAPGPMQQPMSKPGIAGTARQYDGNDDTFSTTDPQNGSLDMGTSSFSYSMWLNVATPNSTFDTPFWKGGTSNGEIGFCILTGTTWYAKIHDGTHFADPSLGTQAAFANKWIHVAAVLDRGAQTFTAYANGAMVNSQSTTTIGTLDNSLDFDLGRTHNNFPYKGLIDEVRLYRTVLTPEWIAAEHSNLADPSFVVFGAEEMH